MTDCPGYVNVKVDVWPTSPEFQPLVNVDLLVSCPPTFSLSFSLPRRDDDVARPAPDDCVLECVFDDGKDARRLLLRPSLIGRRRPSGPSRRRRPSDEDETAAQSYTEDGDRSLDVDRPTFVVAFILAASVALTLVSLCRDACRATRVGRRGRRAACLLYTSPSPRDRQKSRMPSSA